MMRHLAFLAAIALVLAGCAAAPSASLSPPSTVAPSAAASSGAGALTLNYVALGDSWPEGAHCGGCRTFAGLWADGLGPLTGRQIAFTDFTGSREPGVGESETSASLLASLRSNPVMRSAIQTADIILIATGPNELEVAFGPLSAGTCGGIDQADCIRTLGHLWSENFDKILAEIASLRSGQPTAIRLVDAANPFLSDPSMTVGLPEGFATGNGALIFRLLKEAMCDAAAKHQAICVDVPPILNGPTLDQPVDEDSAASMRAVADALLATRLPELP